LQCTHWYGEGVKTDGKSGSFCMIKDPVKPEDQDDLPEERTDGGGAGTFWAVFLIMFFLAGAAVFAKMFGK